MPQWGLSSSVPTPNSPFGIHLNMLSNQNGIDSRQLPLVAQAGFAWVKDTVTCRMLSGAPVADVKAKCGVGNLSGNSTVINNMMAFLNQANTFQLRPLIRIDFLVCSDSTLINCVTPSTRGDIGNYVEFARQVVLQAQMLGPATQALAEDWEISNEPNNLLGTCYTSPPGLDCTFFFQPNNYLQLLQGIPASSPSANDAVTSITSAIKSVNPSAKVYGPALSTLSPFVPSTAHLFENWLQNSFTVNSQPPYFQYTPLNVLSGLLPNVDVFSAHTYRNASYQIGDNPEVSSGGEMTYLGQLSSLRDPTKLGPSTPIANSEMGYQNNPDNSSVDSVPSDAVRAKYEQRAALLDFAAGIHMRAAFVFNNDTPSGVDPWNFIDAPPGEPIVLRPQYYAAKNINSVFNYSLTKSSATCSGSTSIPASDNFQSFMYDFPPGTTGSLCVYWAGVSGYSMFPGDTIDVTVQAPNSSLGTLPPSLTDLYPNGASMGPTIYPVLNGPAGSPAYTVSGNYISFTDLPLKDSPMLLQLKPMDAASIVDTVNALLLGP